MVARTIVRPSVRQGLLPSFAMRVVKDYKQNKYLILMLLPVLVYYVVFHYLPMYGTLIAFTDFSPRLGLWGSTWIGLENFTNFFNSSMFSRVLVNTVTLSSLQILFGFPAPLILALMLNEIRAKGFKSAVQTISYMPHFISIMVLCGMLVDFSSTSGILTQLVSYLTGSVSKNLLTRPELFSTIFVASGIWQEIGFGSIIYLAALSNIDWNYMKLLPWMGLIALNNYGISPYQALRPRSRLCFSYVSDV